MRLGIGIDTGGTYTDAVLYDFTAQTIIASAKALTTKEDLSLGIGNALDALASPHVAQADLIALSTTLATNACVEDKGGRAKLLFIAAPRWVVERVGAEYGLPRPEEIRFLGGNTNAQGEVTEDPDWGALFADGGAWARDACALAVVDRDATENGGVLEAKAKRLAEESFGIPVICGSEMASELNAMKRGASLLLNARLVPLITDFLAAVTKAVTARHITAPIVIVRSDGSMMSKEFAALRPVETLLCGPAASAIGGMALADRSDCLIVDMGGTTTDIAIVKGGVPRRAAEGIQVGRWSTFVRGLAIDTFGLGGDSAIRFDSWGRLSLTATRLIPLSVAASRWPVITTKLRELVSTTKKHTMPLHELFCLTRDESESPRYTEKERGLCRALRHGPLSLPEAAAALGTDMYNINVGRLEEEGVVMRCGLTPTDIMHVKGDFARFDAEAARLGVAFVAACTGMQADALPDLVYDLVKKKLYTNIVRVLLEDARPSFRPGNGGDRLDGLVSDAWDMARDGQDGQFLHFGFRTPAALVGIGAPTHIFLPDVARALGAECVIPPNAGVANALGAILGNVTATAEVTVKPQYTIDGIGCYSIFGGAGTTTVLDRDEAVAIATHEAAEAARAEAARRGAAGEITVSTRVNVSAPKTREGTEVLLGISVIATAIGRSTL